MAEQSIEASMVVLRELYARPDGPRAVLEFLSQRILEAEAAEHVGAGWHERSEGRRGRRNGYKPRTLQGRMSSLGLQRAHRASRKALGAPGSSPDDPDRAQAYARRFRGKKRGSAGRIWTGAIHGVDA